MGSTGICREIVLPDARAPGQNAAGSGNLHGEPRRLPDHHTPTTHHMKLTPFITAAFAASALLFISCEKKSGDASSSGGNGGGAAVSEKDALEAFKRTAMDLKTESKAMKEGGDPMSMMSQAKAMFGKLVAMKSDGLPADLKAALTTAQAKLSTATAALKDLPNNADELKALVAKAATDPTVAEKLTKAGEAFGKIMQEADPLMKKLAEVAKKYNIDLKD